MDPSVGRRHERRIDVKTVWSSLSTLKVSTFSKYRKTKWEVVRI